MKRIFGSAFVVLASSAVAAACVDTSPLDFHPKAQDASIDGAAAATCRECIVGKDSPCKTEYAACLGSSTCAKLAACALRIGCFATPTFEQRVQCVAPCLADAGIAAGNDPGLDLALKVNDCTLKACNEACGYK
jgi:hypothetical protein